MFSWISAVTHGLMSTHALCGALQGTAGLPFSKRSSLPLGRLQLAREEDGERESVSWLEGKARVRGW